MLKPKLYPVIGFATMAAIMFTACTLEAPGSASNPETERENPAIIKDRTGREWEVTHARDVYNMNPDYFNYGLGFGAIPAVDDPTVLEEGASGYPDPGKVVLRCSGSTIMVSREPTVSALCTGMKYSTAFFRVNPTST